MKSLAKFAPKKTGGGDRISEENRSEILRNLHRRKLAVLTESPKKTDARKKSEILTEENGRWRPNQRRKQMRFFAKFAPKKTGGGDRIPEENRCAKKERNSDRRKRPVATE